ncbi:MAG: hypothetical protein WBZ28_07775, partial [Pseudolabrys sp.]
SEVLAANNRIVEGCVRKLHISEPNGCLILTTNGGTNYFLTGRNLSKVHPGQHINISGTVGNPNRGYNRCPTRLIVLGEIRISRISATPGDCPGQ